MAGAEIIASGIGILCLIIFGYVLVGGILSTTENTASAQNDYVLMKESQRETAIKIPDSPSEEPQFINCGIESWMLESVQYYCENCSLTFNITNTGTEMLGNFDQMDVIVTASDVILKGPGFLPSDGPTPADTPIHFKFDPSTVGSGGSEPSGNWSYVQISPDTIHPGMLDAGEKIKVQINNFYFLNLNPPASFTIEVVTPNGVTDTYSE